MCLAGGLDHDTGDQGIDRDPGIFHLVGELLAEALFQGPRQGGADGVVVCLAKAESGVANAELLGDGTLGNLAREPAFPWSLNITATCSEIGSTFK